MQERSRNQFCAYAAFVFLVSAVGTSTRRTDQHRRFPLHQTGPQMGVDGAPGPNNGVPRSPLRSADRNAAVERRVQEVRNSILNWTNMTDGPRNGTKSVPELLPPWMRWTLGSNAERIFSPSPTTQIPFVFNEIKEFPDEVPGLSGDVTGVVQFVLHPKETPGYETGSQRVVQATMRVLVRLGRSTENAERRQDARRRITIVVYMASDATYRMDGETEAVTTNGPPGESPIAQLTVQMRRTKWHRVLLPTTIVQKVLDSPGKVLRLRVACSECADDMEVVLSPRKKKKQQPTRKPKSFSDRLMRIGGVSGGGLKSRKLAKKTGVSNRNPESPGSGVKNSRRSPVLIVRTKTPLRALRPL